MTVDVDSLVAALSTPGSNTSGGAGQRPRPAYTSPEFKGFSPGMVVDDDGCRVVTTPDVLEVLGDETQWRQLCERLGFAVPNGWQVRLTEMRHDPAAWHRDSPGEDAVTRPVWRYRFKIEPASVGARDVDVAGLLKGLRVNRRRVTARHAGEATLVASWNDWQGGKAERGGSEALAERLDDVFTQTEQRGRALKRIGYDLGHLLVIGGGDMVEGCNIFPNQPFELDLDRRGQVNLTTGLILHGLDRLAPLYAAVTVLVVGGNHGENRQGGKRTTRSDNDDVAVFEHAARVAARDPRLGHVRFLIEAEDPAAAVDVGRWRVATTHGHVFGRSGPLERKVWTWMSGKAAARHPAGQADVLVTHHFHHLVVKDFGATLWVQTPAMDGGSPWYTDWSGQYADPGMLTWVMTDLDRFAEPAVLTPRTGV